MDAIVKAEVKLSFKDAMRYASLIDKYHFAPDRRRISKLDIFFLVFSLAIPISHIARAIKSGLDVSDVIWALIEWAAYLFFTVGLRKLDISGGVEQGIARGIGKDCSILFFANHFTVSSQNPEEYLNRTYPYDRYVKSDEWKDAFYLHAGSGKEFIIPKSCLSGGEQEQLSLLLKDKLGEMFRSGK